MGATPTDDQESVCSAQSLDRISNASSRGLRLARIGRDIKESEPKFKLREDKLRLNASSVS